MAHREQCGRDVQRRAAGVQANGHRLGSATGTPAAWSPAPRAAPAPELVQQRLPAASANTRRLLRLDARVAQRELDRACELGGRVAAPTGDGRRASRRSRGSRRRSRSSRGAGGVEVLDEQDRAALARHVARRASSNGRYGGRVGDRAQADRRHLAGQSVGADRRFDAPLSGVNAAQDRAAPGARASRPPAPWTRRRPRRPSGRSESRSDRSSA